jgi:hypothetical protein
MIFVRWGIIVMNMWATPGVLRGWLTMDTAALQEDKGAV